MEHQPTTKLNVFYGLDLDNIFREGEKSVTANINPNTGEPITNPLPMFRKYGKTLLLQILGLLPK
jgi:hypothetical protein